jgi:hypothetical protein
VRRAIEINENLCVLGEIIFKLMRYQHFNKSETAYILGAASVTPKPNYNCTDFPVSHVFAIFKPFSVASQKTNSTRYRCCFPNQLYTEEYGRAVYLRISVAGRFAILPCFSRYFKSR